MTVAGGMLWRRDGGLIIVVVRVLRCGGGFELVRSKEMKEGAEPEVETAKNRRD